MERYLGTYMCRRTQRSVASSPRVSRCSSSPVTISSSAAALITCSLTLVSALLLSALVVWLQSVHATARLKAVPRPEQQEQAPRTARSILRAAHALHADMGAARVRIQRAARGRTEGERASMATWAEMSRMLARSGYTCRRCRSTSVSILGSASAAAITMWSVIVLVWPRKAPSARPGKMYLQPSACLCQNDGYIWWAMRVSSRCVFQCKNLQTARAKSCCFLVVQRSRRQSPVGDAEQECTRGCRSSTSYSHARSLRASNVVAF